MALPGVSILIQNGGLGAVTPTDDAVCGLLLQTDVAPSGLALLTAKQIFSLDDAVALGITAAFDTTNTCRVYKHIKEFYDEAGSGAELWFLLTSKAVTMSNLLDKTQANYAVKLLNAAQGKIRVLGATRSPASGYTPVTTGWGVDADAGAALTLAQALAEEYAVAFKPLRVVVEGLYFTGEPADLKDLRTLTNNRTAMLIGDTSSGNGAAVGLLMGRIASIPVQRNIGRVKDGAAVALAIYYATATLEASGSKPLAVHNKGFVTFRQFVGKAGYFFSDDPTAVVASDDDDLVEDDDVVLDDGVGHDGDPLRLPAAGVEQGIDPAATGLHQVALDAVHHGHVGVRAGKHAHQRTACHLVGGVPEHTLETPVHVGHAGVGATHDLRRRGAHRRRRSRIAHRPLLRPSL